MTRRTPNPILSKLDKEACLTDCLPYQATARETRRLHKEGRKRNWAIVNTWLKHYHKEGDFLLPTARRRAYTIESKEQWWVETLALSQTGIILKHNRFNQEVWTDYIKTKHKELRSNTYAALSASFLHGLPVPTLTGNKAREARSNVREDPGAWSEKLSV